MVDVGFPEQSWIQLLAQTGSLGGTGKDYSTGFNIDVCSSMSYVLLIHLVLDGWSLQTNFVRTSYTVVTKQSPIVEISISSSQRTILRFNSDSKIIYKIHYCAFQRPCIRSFIYLQFSLFEPVNSYNPLICFKFND